MNYVWRFTVLSMFSIEIVKRFLKLVEASTMMI